MGMTTLFPHVEPRLRPLLDAFVAIVRQHTNKDDWYPDGDYRRELYSTARSLAERLATYDIGEAEWEAFMQFAWRQYKKRFNAPFKNFKSIAFLVPEFGGDKENRQRYKQGAYADFWED